MQRSPFSDIHIGWKGQQFTIVADRVMGAIMTVENHVTLAELNRDARRGTLRLGRIAAAYADLLRYAGESSGVTTEQVYEGMFSAKAEDTVVAAVGMLLRLMIPNNPKLAEPPKGEGNRRTRRAAARSSKRHTS